MQRKIQLIHKKCGRQSISHEEKRAESGILPVYSLKEKGSSVSLWFGRGNLADQKLESSILAETMFPFLQAYVAVRLAFENREDGYGSVHFGGCI